jgi:hypothetical protein
MRLVSALVFAATLVFAARLTVVADPAAETAAVQTLFASSKIDPSLFTAAFVAKIPMDGVQQFIDSYKERLGAPKSFDRDGSQLRIVSPHGSIGCDIALDEQGKISNLLFHDEMSLADLDALQKVMSAPNADASLFEESFKTDVPMTKVDDVIGGLRSKFGPFVRIEARKRGYFVVFAHGEAHAQISVNAQDKIDYLAFTESPPGPSPAAH